MLTGHSPANCPGSKRGYISLRDLPNNAERINFFATYYETMKEHPGAPRIEPLADKNGSIRDLCILHYPDVESAKTHIESKASILLTSVSNGKVNLPIIPIDSCTLCLEQGHRPANCPNREAILAKRGNRGSLAQDPSKNSRNDKTPSSKETLSKNHGRNNPSKHGPLADKLQMETNLNINPSSALPERNASSDSDSEYSTDSDETALREHQPVLPPWIRVAKRQPRGWNKKSPSKTKNPKPMTAHQEKEDGHTPSEGPNLINSNTQNLASRAPTLEIESSNNTDHTPACLTRRRYPIAMEQATQNSERLAQVNERQPSTAFRAAIERFSFHPQRITSTDDKAVDGHPSKPPPALSIMPKDQSLNEDHQLPMMQQGSATPTII